MSEPRSSFEFPGESRSHLNDALHDLISKHRIAIEKLTAKQLADALRQAITCGDFIRHLRVDDQAQAVIYIPYAREQRLQSRVKELESILTQFRFEVVRLQSNKTPSPWDTLEYFLRDPKTQLT